MTLNTLNDFYLSLPQSPARIRLHPDDFREMLARYLNAGRIPLAGSALEFRSTILVSDPNVTAPVAEFE